MRNYRNLNPSKEEIKALLESAENRIKSAKILLKEELFRDSISRSYYAFLDSAKALLLIKGKTAKTHAGVLTLLGLEFGKTKEIPLRFFKFYKKVLKDREEADYEILKKFSKDEAGKTIQMAEEFVNYVKKLIKFLKNQEKRDE